MQVSAGSRIGPFEVLAKVGEGGMGEVWRARDPRLDRDVAIKILPGSLAHDPDRLARFEREARTLAALNHPHIAAIYGLEDTPSTGSGQAPGRAIVMELVDGETLADRIARGSMPLGEALAIAEQLADALDAAHERDIVHRDLKPANIKLTADGVVKVLDFGLAKLVAPADVVQGFSPAKGGPEGPQYTNSPTVLSPAMTNVGVILGTAAYMAPEQARGKAVDKRADIWAFGVVLYELLTGRRLFEGETVSDTLAAVLTREPEWDRVPGQARPLLRKCLEKDPKKRLRDIGDAWQLLDATLHASTKQQRAWLWPAVAVLAAVLAALALWAPWRSTPQASDLVRRFQVPIDHVGAPFIEFAVSPDGQYLAYMTFDNGIKRLWLHALDALQGYEVPGAGGASNGAPVIPFWSPDSRHVVFASGGKLRKVAVAGGPPQTICDVSMQGETSGSWSRDGVIILGGRRGILRVPAAGGSTAVVAGTEKTSGSFPTFLPDGRHFLYGSRRGEPGGIATFIGSLDGGPEEQKPLLTADSSVVFAPDGEPNAEAGYLLFRREGSLLAQRFDAARLQLVGEAMPVADRVGSFIDFPFFSASSSGVLIHHPGVTEAQGQLTWLDRSGHSVGTVGDPSAYSSVSIAPDGKTAALVVPDWSKPTRDVWVLSLDRGARTRLTLGPSVTANSGAVWSPDSRQIIYSSTLASPGRSGIHRRSADGTGSEDTLLTGTNTEQLRPTSWSPDGRFVLYDVIAGSGGKRDIWALPLDGRSKPFVYLNSPADESLGVFSQDGRFVAYSSDETGAIEIYVRPFPDPNAGKWVISKGTALRLLSWRQDGKALTYLGASLSVRSVDISTTPTFQPGEPKELFKLASNTMGVAASPDGNRFLAAIPAATGNSIYAPVPFTVVLNWQKALAR